MTMQDVHIVIVANMITTTTLLFNLINYLDKCINDEFCVDSNKTYTTR